MIDAQGTVRRAIDVPVDRQRAFDFFVQRMTEWWPRAHHIGSAPIAEIVIEPREGGRWYTRHEDGSETSTGYVVTWEPPSRLVMSWQITADWTFDPELVTLVELRFSEQPGGHTRVELEHRELHRYGPDAARMRDVFDQPGAWSATLDAYAAGLGGAA
jgi:uncharacterized protein YndB with AHSA1/START domain